MKVSKLLLLLPLFFGLCLTRSAIGAALEVDYLSTQLRIQKPHQALVQSMSDRERFYTYDQALAVIAFAHAGKKEEASQILNAMAALQEPNGAWVFSYPKDQNIQPRTGSISWMLIALNHYQKKFSTNEFSDAREKTIQYLKDNLFQVDGFKGPRFSNIDDPNTAWNEREVLSTEHLIDTIAAFETLPPSERVKNKVLIEDLRKTLKNHWLGDRFASGSTPNKKELHRSEVYLDTQAWGSLLAWNHKDLNWVLKGLHFNCREFNRPKGFFEAKEADQIHKKDFAWLEGSYSMVLALDQMKLSCNSRSPASISQTLSQYQNQNGGVPYTVHNDKVGEDRFTDSLSVASTTWKFLSDQKINPFQLD